MNNGQPIRLGMIVDEKWYTEFFVLFAGLLAKTGQAESILILCMDNNPDPENGVPFVRFRENSGKMPKKDYPLADFIGYEQSLSQFDQYFEGRHKDVAQSLCAQTEEWLDEKPVDCLVVWSGTRLASRTIAETAKYMGYPVVSLETPYFQELPEPPETDFVMNLHRMKNRVLIADTVRAPQTGDSQLGRDWANATVRPGLQAFLRRLHENRVSKFSQSDIKSFLTGKAGATADDRDVPDPAIELFCPPGAKVLLVLGQVDRDSSMYFGDHVVRCWHDLGVALAQRLPDGWVMWFKGHPLDRNYAKGADAFAQELHAINPRCRVLHTTIDIHFCYQRCNAVACINSTATIEAASYGLPVLNLGHGSFTHIGMTYAIQSVDDITPTLESLPARMTADQVAVRERFLSYVLYDYLIPVGSPKKMLARIQQAIREKQIERDGIKLDVGCGPKVRDGYLGVDIRPAPHVAYCCNAWEIDRYVPAGAASAIYSRHFFEHLTYPQADDTLESWKRVLRPGGIVEIVLPDLRFHIDQYLHPEERSITNPNWTNLQHAMAGFYGWQREAKTTVWDVHKSGYDFGQLRDSLTAHGFVDIRRIDDDPWNLHVEAIKPEKEAMNG